MSAKKVIGASIIAEEGAVRVTLTWDVTVNPTSTDDCELPEVPVTVIAYVPTGVAPTPEVVERVRVLEHVVTPGLQDDGLNEAEAPTGNPDAAKLTGEAVPAVLVTVIILVLLVVAPCNTETSLLLEVVKVNGVTIKLKVAVLRRGPLSVTVMRDVPPRVLGAADKVSVMSQVDPGVDGGVQEDEENEAVTPSGSPTTLDETKDTALGAPETVETVMV